MIKRITDILKDKITSLNARRLDGLVDYGGRRLQTLRVNVNFKDDLHPLRRRMFLK
jgi:hypothetical protein